MSSKIHDFELHAMEVTRGNLLESPVISPTESIE